VDRVSCELCGREVELHDSYVVRIDVFAEPSMTPVRGAALAAIDFDDTYGELMAQLKYLTADDLQDAVHRRS